MGKSIYFFADIDIDMAYFMHVYFCKLINKN